MTKKEIEEYLYKNLVYLCKADVLCPNCYSVVEKGERTIVECDALASELTTQMGFKEGNRIIAREIADICSDFMCCQNDKKLDSESLARIIWTTIYSRTKE